MQSTINTSTTSIHQLQFPWKLKSSRRKPIFRNRNHFLPRTLILNASLATSVNYEPEEGLDKSPATESVLPIRLPVVVRQSGRVSRYIWDGSDLKLVGVDGSSSVFALGLEDGLHKLVRILTLAVRNLFIPREVPRNYIYYVKWKLLHRVFSSALQVLATQAMFRAIGIGNSRSLPSAAAFNWVFKDGLGRLSRCVYTASQASTFDSNLKRVRFSSSILFSLSVGIELLTPAFPRYFLLLATLANIAKQISLACYLATESATRQSFAIGNNLGEVSAKAQIQSVCFDNLGLLLAALLNMLLKNNQRLLAGLPFVVYPIFSAIDLFGIYQGLKHVHLQTLTKDRLEIILNSWIDSRHVPSPADVSNEEGINLWRKGKAPLPIRMGKFSQGPLPKLSLMAMQSLTGGDYYFICMDIRRGWARTQQRGIVLCLREGADTAIVIKGMLQACYVRKALLLSPWWETATEERNDSESVLQEWVKLIENSKHSAENDLVSLENQMSELGWATKSILLSTEEQARYSFVND